MTPAHRPPRLHRLASIRAGLLVCFMVGMLQLGACAQLGALKPNAPAASAPKPGYRISQVAVVVDEKAFTSYVAVASDLPAADLQALPEKIARIKGAYLVSWDALVQDADKHLNDRILKNEYPDVRSVESLLQLLQKYPATNFSLTWNGGIAVTAKDHQFARQTHAQYLRDPGFTARPKDRRADPVHPGNHTGPLLGRDY